MVSQSAAPSEDTAWQVAGSRRSRRRNPAAAGSAGMPLCHGGLCGGGAVSSAKSVASAAAAGVYETVMEEVLDPRAVEKASNCVRERASRLSVSAFAKTTDVEVHAAWEAARAAALCSANSAASASTASIAGTDLMTDLVAPEKGRIVCLGIGSVVASAASAWQLALALHLAETLGITDRAWADPQMRAADVAVGEEFGFARIDPSVAPDTAAMAKSHSGPLLLFMPHCDRALYERVLAANWEGGEICLNDEGGFLAPVAPPLGRVVLVGNSFKVYSARDELFPTTVPAAPEVDAGSRLDRPVHNVHTGRLLQRLGPLAHERPLPEFEQCPEAFNDTAILTFSCEALIVEALAGRHGHDTSNGDALVTSIAGDE